MVTDGQGMAGQGRARPGRARKGILPRSRKASQGIYGTALYSVNQDKTSQVRPGQVRSGGWGGRCALALLRPVKSG